MNVHVKNRIELLFFEKLKKTKNKSQKNPHKKTGNFLKWEALLFKKKDKTNTQEPFLVNQMLFFLMPRLDWNNKRLRLCVLYRRSQKIAIYL